MSTESKLLWGVAWKGCRSGHTYVSLFAAEAHAAAVMAYQHLVTEGSLPDYSPGCGLVEPLDCLELGESDGQPAEHRGLPINYIGDTGATPPYGAD